MSRFHVVATITLCACLLMLTACGGNASPRGVSTTPTPSTPTPAPTPTSVPSVSPTTFQAGLLNTPNVNTSAPDVGKLAINNGAVTYQFANWTANMPFTIDFCSFPVQSPADCFTTNSAGTTDMNGAATGTFQFPKSGTFAGWFRFNGASSGSILATGFSPGFTGGMDYQTALVTMSGEPIKSSAVTVTNGAVHIQVNGAMPNTSYAVFEASAVTNADQIGTLTTDANGNGTADLRSAKAQALITLGRNGSQSNLLTGFVVP